MSSEAKTVAAEAGRTDLRGKVAVVTGASKGIGASIAKTLAARGASVVVNYASSKEGAEKVVDAIRRAGGDAIAVAGSVADPDAVRALFAEAKNTYGKVDILVNNAGVYAFSSLDDITVQMMSSMYDVNVKGLLLATQAAVRLFPAEGGVIVNIGSGAAELAPPMGSVYAGTKAALNTMTRSLAKELGPKKIRVNAVNPGPVATEGFHAAGFAGSDFEKWALQNTPLGRLGEPDEIAAVVAFLVSNDARWVTGALIEAAGGLR